MTSKHKDSRKRRSFHLEDTTSRVIDPIETLVNRSNGIENDDKVSKNGNNDAQSHLFHQVTSDEPQQKYRKIFNSEEYNKIFSVFSKSKKGKCPKCKYKKIYKSKLRDIRNKFKNKQSVFTNDAVNINTSENVDSTCPVEDNTGKKKQNHSAETLPTKSNTLQVTDRKKVIVNGLNSMLYHQNVNIFPGKAKSINFERSVPSSSLIGREPHRTIDKKSSNDKFLKESSVLSTRSISSVGHLDDPPLKSIIKVTATSIPTPSSNKSPPTSVSTSTRKRTIPKQPVCGVASQNEIDDHRQAPTSLPSTSQQRDHSHPSSRIDKKRSKQYNVFEKSYNITKEAVSSLKPTKTHAGVPIQTSDNMSEDIKGESTDKLQNENYGITISTPTSQPDLSFQDNVSEDNKEVTNERFEDSGISISYHPSQPALPQPSLPFQILDNISEDTRKEKTEMLENSSITNSAHLSEPIINFQTLDNMSRGLKEESMETFENENFGITISSHPPQPALPFQIPDNNVKEHIKEESTETHENENSNIIISFHPPETSKHDNTSPWVLQDNSWSAYILRNIEMLYKDERHCDLDLKFYGGEVLKSHRTILSACTSLLSGHDAMQDVKELVVPEDLNYASVRPVIKFIYSGRLEMEGSDIEINAIYCAAKRLNVPPLIHLMELYCPYLSPSHSKSLTSMGDSEKLQNLISQKNNSCSNLLASPQSSSLGNSCKCVTTKATALTPLVANEHDKNAENFKDYSDTETERSREQDNSRKHPQSASPKSCIKPQKAAKPTRFELQDDSEMCSETSSFEITPSTSCVLPSIPVTTSPTHPPVYTSPSVYDSSLETLSYTSHPSQTFKNHLNAFDGNMTKEQQCITNQVSNVGQVTQSKETNLEVPNENMSNDVITYIDENNHNINLSKQETYDHAGKSSRFCRQLEELEDILQGNNFKKENNDEKNSSCSKNEELQNEEFNLSPNVPVPLKSILKKKYNKGSFKKQEKHVSFQMNENNELLNEVATYSLSKEPAQSFVDIKKTKETSKSLTNTPMKLTLSINKNMLMNLPLSDSEAISSSNLQGKKLHSKGDASDTKNHLDNGDITSHAKLVSEFLKKYPHVVKDKKKIGIKILKKENENFGGDKLKTKIQYVVLSDIDSQSKLADKPYKNSSTNSGQNISHIDKIFKCPECDNIYYKTYFMLKKHVSSYHKDNSSAILSRIENVPYSCYTCLGNRPLEFPNYLHYKKHMKDVHGKTYLRLCKICGLYHGHKLELAYHQYIEHNLVSKSFCFPKCDLCEHVALNKHALLKHKLEHGKADLKFCTSGALHGHILSKRCQTNPSVNYKCPHCPLTFGRSYSLKAHCRSTHKSLQTSAQSVSKVKEKHIESLPSHNSE